MSYVAASWVQPTLTAELTGTGMMVDADHAFLKHGLDGSGVRIR